ncbi:Protein N-acetyltransferase, RimJ/RimL family [Prauserella aidingensis]|uniref:GNAT family N-acetyltransferase n=1 Tax=Prauserella aidingensis TaxID=387890 RepID=UPI0020A53DCC|nr:GNAT family protein [Prauserella aidingensis]MCP2251564.1 Protein N-acetyltransferase, RimJ/RimL family [Prauserella aidingensis]
MIPSDVFRDLPVLTDDRVRLVPLGEEHFDGVRRMLDDPEVRRLTGTHHTFTDEEVRRLLATRSDHHDRADWAITDAATGAFLGEAVLHELDPPNAAAGYRIALLGPEAFSRGYGTASTRLVRDYAFDVAGLHRVGLEVFDFNVRAQRVYEKCGFVREGIHRQAIWWNGIWHDMITMGIVASDPRPG